MYSIFSKKYNHDLELSFQNDYYIIRYDIRSNTRKYSNVLKTLISSIFERYLKVEVF